MKHVRQQTAEFYNRHAQELSASYQAIGSRHGDISLGFSLAGNPEAARILEIGCGYGREAAEIVKRTPFYTGIDVSSTFIDLAKSYVPEGRFICADAVEYDYPGRYHIVFAFAAMRHLDQEDMAIVLRKVYDCLREGGILYMSLNYGRRYMEQVREEGLGRLTQYLYNSKTIIQLAGEGYQNMYQTRNTVGHAEWFELALRKPAIRKV